MLKTSAFIWFDRETLLPQQITLTETDKPSGSITPSDKIDSHAYPIQLTYLAEGNANILFRITSAPNHQTPARNQSLTDLDHSLEFRPDDFLLRLHKNKPFIASAKDQFSFYETKIVPLFDRFELVDRLLVRVNRHVLLALNERLVQMDVLSRTGGLKRDGDVIDDKDGYGFLVRDMSPLRKRDLHEGTNEALNGIESYGSSIQKVGGGGGGEGVWLEIKPKWLISSPDIDGLIEKDKIRQCQTCASRARKSRINCENKEERGGRETHGFCPLALLLNVNDDDPWSEEKEKWLAAIKILFKDKNATEDDIRAMSWLVKSKLRPVLEKIRNYQKKFTTVNLQMMNADLSNMTEEYLLARTLRDCAIFLRTSTSLSDVKSENVNVDARIADLDAKMLTVEKGKYWRDTEKILVNEGWYECRETGNLDTDSVCVLSSHSPTQ